MAKNGFSMSDRKKIVDVTGNRTITKSDCGTIFTIGAATTTITLPLISDAAAGWWCKFVVNNEAAAVTINQNASDTANQMIGHVKNYTDNASVQLEPATEGDAFDVISFTVDVIQGDWVEIYTDGTLWYVDGCSNSGVATAIGCA